MKSWTAIALAPPLLVSLLLLGCAEPPPAPTPTPEETAAPAAAGWRAKVAIEAGYRIHGLASGDLPAHAGRELVAVGAGGVVVAWRQGETWRTETIDAGRGPLHGVLIADVDPSLEGVEVVVVGETEDGRGRAELLSWSPGGGWRVTRLAAPPEPLLAVGLFGEVPCVVGKRLSVLRRSERVWRAIEIAQLSSPGLSLSASAKRVLVGCADGGLLEFRSGVDGHRPREVDRRVAARSALATSGRHVLAADGDGTLALLPAANEKGLPARYSQQDRIEIFRSARPLTGCVLADLDPKSEGLELMTCGEAGELVLLSADGDGRYQPATLLRELSPLRCLIALDARSVATGSEGGTVTVLTRFD